MRQSARSAARSGALLVFLILTLLSWISWAQVGARELGTVYLGRFEVTPVIWKPVTDEGKQMFRDMAVKRGMRWPEPGKEPSHQIAVFVKDRSTGEVVHGLKVKVTLTGPGTQMTFQLHDMPGVYGRPVRLAVSGRYTFALAIHERASPRRPLEVSFGFDND